MTCGKHSPEGKVYLTRFHIQCGGGMVFIYPSSVSPGAMVTVLCEFTSLRGTVCFRRIKTFLDGQDKIRQLNQNTSFPTQWKQDKHPTIRLSLRTEGKQEVLQAYQKRKSERLNSLGWESDPKTTQLPHVKRKETRGVN